MGLKIILSFFLSFVSSLIIFPFFIKMMKGKNAPIRDFLSQDHVKQKQKTPSMGGIVIFFVSIFSTLLFADLTNTIIILIILFSGLFTALGFLDDYLKLKQKNHFTITTRRKLFAQFFLAWLFVFLLNLIQKDFFSQNYFIIPFFQIFTLNLGFIYSVLRVFTIAGTLNGVNLTDGLDGLVSVPMILNLIFFGFIAYCFSGHKIFFETKSLNFKTPYFTDIVIYCASITGALFGFLKYNFKPAKIFMGDTGSLFLGSSLGLISVTLKQEFLLFVVGFLFVIETATSFIQIFLIRTGRKRLFKMCPIHHHFEFYKWSEKKIVFSFWFFSFIFFIIALLIFIKSYS